MHPSSRPLRRLSPTKLQAYVSPLEFFFFSFFLSPALCVESPSFSAVHLGLIFFPQVALVDTTGVIVTALSSSDLRVLTTGHKFRLKGITALQLVQKSRALEANARPAIVCARLTTHLSEIASKLAATGLHRIFILDDQENPIGVISVRDLIRFILPYFTKKTYDWAHRA
eukprot:m.237983 g.237983  ORF g.237983 m.237983 type:complete len:170 (-) comp54343_c1_seq2:158-667(-)